MRKSSTPQSHHSEMSPTPSSSTVAIPSLDSVLMDIDSDLEADQVAQDTELVLRQAQEKVRLVAEAQERHREDWKRNEEEKKA